MQDINFNTVIKGLKCVLWLAQKDLGGGRGLVLTYLLQLLYLFKVNLG